MAITGYKPTAGSGGPDSAVLDPGWAIAYVADAPTENGFVYAIAGRFARYDAAEVSLDLGVFSTSAGNPDEAIGHITPFTVSSSTEGEYQRTLDAAVRINKDVPIAFAAFASGGRLLVDMAGAQWIPGADNMTFYWDAGTELHEDWATDSSSYEGNLAIWGLYETNVVPDAPIGLTPGSTTQGTPTTISDTTPTFTAEFHDDNQVLPNGLAGDKIKRYRVQLYRDDTGALVWDTGARTASSSDVATSTFTVTYDGPALSNAVTYRWRASVADLFDGWSAPSGYRYISLAAGRVDTTTATPVGKTNSRTPGPFVAKWLHSAARATNAVEVRILDNNSGATVRASATLAVSVAANANISIAFATAFPSYSLPWSDARYRWEMRARDTANVWSGWASQAFYTNDPPQVPSLYAPAANAVVTTYPLLQASCTDTDDTISGVTVTFRMMNATGTVLVSRAGTYNATTKRYQYQTIAADFPNSFAVYLWDAYAFDGVVYSGGVTTVATAQTSADRQMTYAQGPVVVISSPTDGATITTQTPAIVYTAPTQVSRRITVVRDGVTIHDFSNTTTSHGYTLPAVLSTGEQLHELDAITVKVDVTDSNGIHGSDSIALVLDYPTPPALQPSLTMLKGRGDISPTIPKISWPRSTYSVDDFRYYRLERRISADMLAANPSLPDDPVVFKRMEITQNSYLDYEATSGVEYEYRLRQYVTQGADVLASSTRSVVVLVQFDATILHAVDDPESWRLVFDARKDRTITAITDFSVVSPWNQRKPVQFESDVYYHEIETEWVLAAKTPQDANYDLIRLRLMVQRGAIINYRDGRGNNFYGRFSSPPVVHDPPGGRLRTVRATFRELAYDPSSKD